MKKYFIPLFIILILEVAFVTGQEQAPTIPHSFSGTITYPNKPNFPLEGYEITAEFNGESVGRLGFVERGGNYTVEIDTKGAGGEVIFYIGGIEALPHIQKDSFPSSEGTDTNLIINADPQRGLCGNDAIDVGEQCDGDNFGFFGDGINQCPRYDSKYESGNLNCSSECKIETFQCILKPEPPPNNNNGNGGGSSGGGGNGGNPPTSNNQNDNPQDFVFLGEETSEDPTNIGESEQPQNSATFLKIIKTVGPFLVAGFLIGLIVASLAIRKYRKKRFTKN